MKLYSLDRVLYERFKAIKVAIESTNKDLDNLIDTLRIDPKYLHAQHCYDVDKQRCIIDQYYPQIQQLDLFADELKLRLSVLVRYSHFIDVDDKFVDEVTFNDNTSIRDAIDKCGNAHILYSIINRNKLFLKSNPSNELERSNVLAFLKINLEKYITYCDEI